MLRRLLFSVVAMAVIVTSCGDDGESSSSDTGQLEQADGNGDQGGDGNGESGGGSGPVEVDEMFCDALQDLSEIDPDAIPTESDVEMLEAAVDAAPEGIRDALDLLASTAAAFLDPASADVPDVTEEELVEAAATLNQAAEACRVEIPLFEEDIEAGREDDQARDAYDSDELRAAVETAVPGVDVRTVARVNDQVTMQIPGLDDTATAQRACAVGATYLSSIGFSDAEVRVADGSDQEVATCTADG
jgi:hypothetical protein